MHESVSKDRYWPTTNVNISPQKTMDDKNPIAVQLFLSIQRRSIAQRLTLRICSGGLRDHVGAPCCRCDVRRRVRVPQPLLRRPPATRHDARPGAKA